MSTGPRTITLCIFLFLASALITLTVQNTSPADRWVRHTSSRASSRHSTQQPLANRKFAFATFLAGSGDPNAAETGASNPDIDDNTDGYFLSTRVLNYQFLHSPTVRSNATIPFLVLVTPDVPQRKRDKLTREGATVVQVEKLPSDWMVPSVARWADLLAKLRLLQFTQYDKICFVDADTLVTHSIEGVFHDEATLTEMTGAIEEQIQADEAPLPSTYMFASHADMFGYGHEIPSPEGMSYLNAGFFVLRPSNTLFDYYTSLLNLPGRFDSGSMEQNLLNYAHRREGNMPWRALWYGWNVNWPTERDLKAGARSFHAKYWDGDPTHDPVLKQLWREQRAEMEGYYWGREGKA